MAFEKVKTLRAAEKHLEMGKIPAAIKEYCKIVEDDPSDFTTLNILGDLHVRTGNPAAAISCFRRIAEHYREQEFALKAIAMFRKIDRLKPNDIEIATSLANLYAQQELVVEARAHYLVVADAHAKSGDTQAGLEILSKIADLDPQNTAVRLKLAEGYLHEGMNAEAAAAFAEAGNSLCARGALDEALDAFNRSLDLQPDDIPTLNGLLSAHAARGTADEAAEKIAQVSSAKPDDTELLSLLLTAYIQAEDPQQAEATIDVLVAKDSAAYLRFVDVARLYLASDSIDAAVGVLARISEQMLTEREDRQLLELVNEFLTRDTDNVQALRLLVRVYWWQRDVENLRGALDRMAEAAEAAGLADDERYALTQLTRLAPEDTAYAERLQQLGGADEAAAEELPSFEAAVEGAHESTEFGFSEFAISNEDGSSSDETTFEWNSEPQTTAASDDAGGELDLERGFTFETVVSEELAEAGANGNGDDADRRATLRLQELESVDFYIAQGYADIAIDTLNLLETQFGKHPDIDSRRQKLAQGADAPMSAFEFEAPAAPEPAQPVADFSFIPENIEPSPLVAEQPSVLSSPPIDAGLAAVFEEYRVSAEAESNGDFETHYNLGLAYQEMDLFEEALEEFQMAVGLVSADDGTARYLQCCNLIGHCFMKKGVPRLAVKWFNKGLNAPNTSDDERQALRFDLAAAHEQAGDLNEAKNLFTEIYGVNVSYRGVNERLKSLESRMV
ncbi:MAG TPA: tetratricopeptide repeat protein [Pyrinomonadaceae bacterium]|nr:tetratricopeptide repeat protein [Pyrinomonadaceae bacterium]